MSINIDDCLEINEEGFAITNSDGEALFYLATGDGSPVGNAAPVNTWYTDRVDNLIYYKFGLGDNDWRQLRAADIAFNPIDSQNNSSLNVKDAIDTLSNRHYGKDFSLEEKVASETVSGGSFVTYSTLNFVTTNEANTNRYRLNCDFIWGHDSASNDIRVRALLDGSQIGEEMRVEPKDQGAKQRIQNNLLAYGLNLTNGNHVLELQYRPASASRTSRMFRSRLEVWRVS